MAVLARIFARRVGQLYIPQDIACGLAARNDGSWAFFKFGTACALLPAYPMVVSNRGGADSLLGPASPNLPPGFPS